jgi:hypothetical protein
VQVLERPPCSLVSGVGVAQHCAGLVMCRLFGNWSNRSNLTASEQQKSACTACRTRAYKHTHTQTHTHAPTPTPTREHLTPAHTLHTSNSSLPLSQFMKCCAASVLTGWGWGGLLFCFKNQVACAFATTPFLLSSFPRSLRERSTVEQLIRCVCMSVSIVLLPPGSVSEPAPST